MADFYRPDTLEQALSLLERHGDRAVIVNGGSDIVIEISQKRIHPDAIVSIGGIAELKTIEERDGFLCIGGSVTYREILNSSLCKPYKGLIQAVSCIGSPAIRAVGTPAGNIVTGAPAADCATMLAALGAQPVWVQDRILTEIRIPALKSGEGTGYFRVSRRKAQDIGKVLVGSRVRLEGGVIAEAAISLGAVNAKIARAESLEKVLPGKTPAEALGYLKRTFPEEAGLRESYFKEYKQQVVPAVVAKSFGLALEDAAERSGAWHW